MDENEIEKLIKMAEKGTGFIFAGDDFYNPRYDTGEKVHGTHVAAYDKNNPKNAHEFVKILNLIPALLSDVDTLSKIAAKQQEQISILLLALDTIASGRMHQEGVDKINAFIERMKEPNMKELGSGSEYTLELAAAFSNDNDETRDSASSKKRSGESHLDFDVSVNGVLKLLSGLKIGGGSKEMRESWDKATSYFRKITKEGLLLKGKATYRPPSFKYFRTDSGDKQQTPGNAGQRGA